MLLTPDVSKGLVQYRTVPSIFVVLLFFPRSGSRSESPPPTSNIMNNTNAKRMRETELTPEDFILWGKEIQNKIGRAGSDALEDRAFREFFGMTANVVSKIWGKLTETDRVPIEVAPKHLLWSFYFMRAYPKQGVTCAVVGGSAGAIDPKTLRKFIWPLIEATADLFSDVVSLLCIVCSLAAEYYTSPFSRLFIFCSRLFLRTGKRVAVSTTASSALTALTAASPSKVWL